MSDSNSQGVSIYQIFYETSTPKGNSEQGNIEAAIARTVSRSLALYFARPVRLFRPAKGAYALSLPYCHYQCQSIVNGWHILKNLAKREGVTLNHQYLFSLVKLQGV